MAQFPVIRPDRRIRQNGRGLAYRLPFWQRDCGLLLRKSIDCLEPAERFLPGRHFSPYTNEVKDKVFCLSRTEEYLLSDEAKKCKPTEYCRSKGVDTYENGNCKWWWHRESGLQQEDTPVYSGATIWYRRYWIADKQAVRPALWINLDA